jgi:hypothetical protein
VGIDCRPVAWSVPAILVLSLVLDARERDASCRAPRADG